MSEASAAGQTLLSLCRKEGSRLPGGGERVIHCSWLQFGLLLLSLPWVPGSDSLWAAGQAVKRGVCEAFSFLMLYQAAENSSIFSQRWCGSGEWQRGLNSCRAGWLLTARSEGPFVQRDAGQEEGNALWGSGEGILVSSGTCWECGKMERALSSLGYCLCAGGGREHGR